jgi:hypothetical protein
MCEEMVSIIEIYKYISIVSWGIFFPNFYAKDQQPTKEIYSKTLNKYKNISA